MIQSYLKPLRVLFIASVLMVSCNEQNLVQNSPPPIDSQAIDISTKEKGQQRDIIEGEYIVTYKDQFEGRISENIALQADLRTDQILSSLNIKEDSVLNRYKYALKGFAARLTKNQVELLKLDPRVERVTPNERFYLSAIVSESASSNHTVTFMGQTTPWGVTRVGGAQNGSGKKAWIIDSGIDLNHPDLVVDISNSVSFIATESADDGYGHGTHVAGIIAALNNSSQVVGVAAGATVVAVKACYNDPFLGCPVSSIVNAIDYVSIKASPNDIVNMSLGGISSITDIDDAVTAAANAGIRFSIAAGNSASNASNFTPARVNNSNVWTVSAFRQGDQFVQTFDWNTPNCNPFQSPYVGSNFSNPPVDFSGPGESVLSLWKNGGTLTTCGTSMAAPHIAGLLLASPNQIVTDGYVTNDPDGNSDPIAAFPVLDAPSIFALVVNGKPKLSWSTVQYADSYKIYRRIENGNWSWIGSVTTTTFTDNTKYSANMSVLFGIPIEWDDILSYKIKATASGLDDSPYSNISYFDESGGGPIQ